jgi:hypothetical protein
LSVRVTVGDASQSADAGDAAVAGAGVTRANDAPRTDVAAFESNAP